jgi:hypothetical protein
MSNPSTRLTWNDVLHDPYADEDPNQEDHEEPTFDAAGKWSYENGPREVPRRATVFAAFRDFIRFLIANGAKERGSMRIELPHEALNAILAETPIFPSEYIKPPEPSNLFTEGFRITFYGIEVTFTCSEKHQLDSSPTMRTRSQLFLEDIKRGKNV